jgi:hypothetical protein
MIAPRCLWNDGCDSIDVYSRGLCYKHYTEARVAGLFDLYPKIINKGGARKVHILSEAKSEEEVREIMEPEKNKTPTSDKVKGKNVALPFVESDKDLLEFLKKLAKKERRTLEQQIMRILEELMEEKIGTKTDKENEA